MNTDATSSRPEPQFYEVQSLFERNLAFFRKKARKFYNKNLSTQATKEQSEEWKKRRKADFEHLKAEAQHLKNISGIYEIQETYRQNARGVPGESRKLSKQRRQDLQCESHHPSKDLEQNMRACGRPKPSSQHTAHHVIPGTGKLKDVINDLRIQMALYGIGINDGDNGAWMLTKKANKPYHWFNEQAKAHREIHTHNYGKWLQHKLSVARTEDHFREILKEIGFLLETGSQPPECSAPPINGWPA